MWRFSAFSVAWTKWEIWRCHLELLEPLMGFFQFLWHIKFSVMTDELLMKILVSFSHRLKCCYKQNQSFYLSQICSVLLPHASRRQRHHHLSPSSRHRLADSPSQLDQWGTGGENSGGAGELPLQGEGNRERQEDQWRRRRRRKEGGGRGEWGSAEGQLEKSVPGGGVAGIWPQPRHLHRWGYMGACLIQII